MGIVSDQNKDDEATRFMQPEIDKGCFLCGESVTVPFIYWAGRPSWIVLHPDCAANLTLALSRDLHEIKKTTGTRLAFTDSSTDAKRAYQSDLERYKLAWRDDICSTLLAHEFATNRTYGFQHSFPYGEEGDKHEGKATISALARKQAILELVQERVIEKNPRIHGCYIAVVDTREEQEQRIRQAILTSYQRKTNKNKSDISVKLPKL